MSDVMRVCEMRDALCVDGCEVYEPCKREMAAKQQAAAANVVTRITTERRGTYGPFFNNAVISQQLKDTMREHPTSKWNELADDMQEALDQFALKISRILTGDPKHLDNWDDIGGYAKCVTDRLRAEGVK